MSANAGGAIVGRQVESSAGTTVTP